MSASKLNARLRHHESAGVDNRGRELPANRMTITVDPSGKYTAKDGQKMLQSILKMAKDKGENLKVNRWNVFIPGQSESLPEGDWHEMVPAIKAATRENAKAVLSFAWIKTGRGTRFPVARLNLIPADKVLSQSGNQPDDGSTDY